MPAIGTVAERLVDAACEAAEAGCWRTLTIADLAQRAGVGREEAEARFAGREDVLDSLARQIDERVAASLDDEGFAEAPPKDRLLEALMCRLEFLTPRRAALRVFGADAQRCPVSAVRTVRRMHTSMGNALDLAGLSGSEPERAVRAAALVWIWARTCRDWLFADEERSADSAYARLDRDLNRLRSLVRCRRPGSGAERAPAESR